MRDTMRVRPEDLITAAWGQRPRTCYDPALATTWRIPLGAECPVPQSLT